MKPFWFLKTWLLVADPTCFSDLVSALLVSLLNCRFWTLSLIVCFWLWSIFGPNLCSWILYSGYYLPVSFLSLSWLRFLVILLPALDLLVSLFLNLACWSPTSMYNTYLWNYDTHNPHLPGSVITCSTTPAGNLCSPVTSSCFSFSFLSHLSLLK